VRRKSHIIYTTVGETENLVQKGFLSEAAKGSYGVGDTSYNKAVDESQGLIKGANLIKRDKDAVLKLHRNAQRLLRPLAVVNPYARALTFLDERTRARRDFPKYLTLIRTLTLLHQHQRAVKTVQHEGNTVEYVEVTLEDIATANRLASAVLGRSLDDLPPQTRRLLTLLDEWVKKGCRLQGVTRGEYRFTRRQLREVLRKVDLPGWNDAPGRLRSEVTELLLRASRRAGRVAGVARVAGVREGVKHCVIWGRVSFLAHPDSALPECGIWRELANKRQAE
jgi:hypothetical protein